ncbi:MAG: transcriptional regulator, AraC family [Variovorax sp.]|nr:transcriptional regulator, AraC family [Variovorax sp.]
MQSIHRWSTDDVDPSRRLEYYAAATSAALIPLSITCGSKKLDATAERTALGPLAVMRMKGSAHGVVHGLWHVARSVARRYYLMLNVATGWAVAQGGHTILAPGEMVLIDSALPYRLQLRAYEIVTLDMPSSWLQQRVRRPDLFAGRRLSGDSLGGRLLAALLLQLTPAFAADSPLPGDFVADQIGALLAGIETEMTGCAPLDAGSHRAPFEISASAQRARTAARMLGSRMFRALPVEEIARRAGYESVVEMNVALHRHGQSPERSAT